MYVGPEEEEALPYNTSRRAIVVITDCPQENEEPIHIPPPGICQLSITPSSHDSPLVQHIVHAALHHIQASSSATPNGVFFEEDVADIEEVLSLASQLRHPDRGPEATDPKTSHLMEQLHLIWSHNSKQVVFRGPLFALPHQGTPHPQNTIPVLAVPVSEDTMDTPSSGPVPVAPQSDAPE